jgi:NhaA family Na+:H+ antiporter
MIWPSAHWPPLYCRWQLSPSRCSGAPGLVRVGAVGRSYVGLVHASGVHATVAGVLLGFAVPVKATERARVLVGTDHQGHDVYDGLAARFADRWEVISSTVAVPIFAFFSTGITVGGLAGLSVSLTDSIAIVTGLVVGKAVGITGTVALLTRSRQFILDATLGWAELVGMSFVAGIGFTVALLVGDLAYGEASTVDAHVKVGDRSAR